MNVLELGSFVALLSTGEWVNEVLLTGALSPWQILMERCRRESIYLTDLRLMAGLWTVTTKADAPGYAQAVRIFKGQVVNHGTNGDRVHDERAFKGVGFVTEDRQFLKMHWASTRLIAKCLTCGFAAKLDAPMEPRPCENPKGCGGQLVTVYDAWSEPPRPIVGNRNIIWSRPREGGQELDYTIRDGHLWTPGPTDEPVRES